MQWDPLKFRVMPIHHTNEERKKKPTQGIEEDVFTKEVANTSPSSPIVLFIKRHHVKIIFPALYYEESSDVRICTKQIKQKKKKKNLSE